MIRFVLGRFGRIAVQVFLILSLVFVLFRIAPGDPASLMLGGNASQDAVDRLRQQLGYDRPIGTQYLDYLGHAAHGDLGTSTSYSRPVIPVIVEHIGPTFSLLVVSMVLAVVLGMVTGTVAAVRPGSWFARGSLLGAVVLLSMPNFWIGMLLIQFFAVQLRWLPAVGYTSLASLILPSIAVASRLIALIARLTRGTVTDVLAQDFITTARARGVSTRRLVLVHALRPALPHVLTLIGLQAGYLLGGAVVIEFLFSYPGMGQLLLSSVSQRDYPLVQGITIFFVAGFLLINVLVDLVSSKVDPRLQTTSVLR